MTTINTYEVYFKIALYPGDINENRVEEQDDEDSIINGEFIADFNKYLCTEQQSTNVLKFLKKEYENINVADVCIFDLEFNNNGKFNCKIPNNTYPRISGRTSNSCYSRRFNGIIYPCRNAKCGN